MKLRAKIKEDREFSKKIPGSHLGGRPEKEGIILEHPVNEMVENLEEVGVQTENTYFFFCQREERKAT